VTEAKPPPDPPPTLAPGVEPAASLSAQGFAGVPGYMRDTCNVID